MGVSGLVVWRGGGLDSPLNAEKPQEYYTQCPCMLKQLLAAAAAIFLTAYRGCLNMMKTICT